MLLLEVVILWVGCHVTSVLSVRMFVIGHKLHIVQVQAIVHVKLLLGTIVMILSLSVSHLVLLDMWSVLVVAVVRTVKQHLVLQDVQVVTISIMSKLHVKRWLRTLVIQVLGTRNLLGNITIVIQ
jgi:hypothetical protein